MRNPSRLQLGQDSKGPCTSRRGIYQPDNEVGGSDSNGGSHRLPEAIAVAGVIVARRFSRRACARNFCDPRGQDRNRYWWDFWKPDNHMRMGAIRHGWLFLSKGGISSNLAGLRELAACFWEPRTLARSQGCLEMAVRCIDRERNVAAGAPGARVPGRPPVCTLSLVSGNRINSFRSSLE